MTDKTADLTRAMTPDAGLRRIVAVTSEDFADHLARLMTDDDPEGPHRARVALRRFRSALAGFAPVIEPSARREMAAQARGLFRCLGRLRDADVLLAGCVDPRAVAGLAAEADRVRAEVREDLTAQNAARFAPDLAARLAATTWQEQGKRGQRWRRRGLDRLGRRALGRAFEDCLDHGPNLVSLATEPRHELRKNMKTLRYLSEYFAPFWAGARRDGFLKHLRALQDNLGLCNDLALARALTGDTSVTPPEVAALGRAQTAWKALQKAKPFWIAA